MDNMHKVLRIKVATLRILSILLILSSCGKKGKSEKAPMGPAPQTGEEQTEPERERTLVLSDFLISGRMPILIAEEPFYLKTVAEDLSGLYVTYEITQCTPNNSKPPTDSVNQVLQKYCDTAFSLDDEGTLKIESPRSLGIEWPDTENHNDGRLSFRMSVQNGIEDDTIKRPFGFKIIDIDAPKVDIVDTQYDENSIEDLPSQLKSAVTQIAYHGDIYYRYNDKRLGAASEPLSGSWYLDSYNGTNYMVSAYHTMHTGAGPRTHPITFPYGKIQGVTGEIVYANKELDFALHTFDLNIPGDIDKFHPMPIDIHYTPIMDDELVSIGYAKMNVSYTYPGIDMNPTCRIASSNPFSTMPEPFTKFPGFPTGCQVWNGDSGGIMALRSTGKVTSVITNTLLSDRWSHQANRELQEGLIEDGQYVGAIHISLSMIREKIRQEANMISEKHLEFVKNKFEL